ncbi:pyruvate dehydrogenase E1 component beta subunit [Granulicatella balaenopterae]|uniref:Pyruvate dehydrogenase E1 component beta subunit n=1 Tax=Granulicatella balaenopterae TaxID=137733 RepID=A0A1H9HEJ5_9LACT|nr:alpha-ketoacid dehydrogenase subunit beta [Granulicatella balaenopterae]SEQ60760.1 pyruvate dehydrogenase E1 component beta subunit [Granulicatella balaenopterae]
MANLTLAQAVTAGLKEVLKKDEKTLIFGEDVGKNGGVFRITDGLQAEFGEDRVFDTPLAESGILGMATGLATEGFRPIPEIQFSGFILEAMDPVVAQISRFRYRYGNTRNMPITIRAPYGGGVHTPELHSDSLEGILAQVPGIRVVIPSSSYDAKGLMISSVESNDPVIFLEHLKLYRSVKGEVPDGYYTVPLDKAAVVREGKDITLVGYGLMVPLAVKAAEKLAKEGIEAEVIDLRTVAPFDMETIKQSIEKTHRVVVMQEAQRIGGLGGQLASEINDQCFMELDAPIGRVSGPDTVYPFGMAESVWIPDEQDIYQQALETVKF